ncbi:S26 family signal peptidase [Streptomyces sp. 5.8]|uniref:S26 family signal peptidase n=1 Tax=Streptomyces sp. 5.8 TaxID=3406571 RepID=UPI003BB69258
MTLNGKPLAEPYILDQAVPATAAFGVTAPEGRMFLMGDNRFNSVDSHLMTGDGNGGTLPLSAVWGVPTETPVLLLAAAAGPIQ